MFSWVWSPTLRPPTQMLQRSTNITFLFKASFSGRHNATSPCRRITTTQRLSCTVVRAAFSLNRPICLYKISALIINKKSQSNLGKAASQPSRQRITTPQSPHWLQWHAPHLPPKLLLFLSY